MENIEILSVDFLFNDVSIVTTYNFFTKFLKIPYILTRSFSFILSLFLSTYISRSKHLKMAICLYSHHVKISSNRNLCNSKIFTISSFRHVTQDTKV